MIRCDVPHPVTGNTCMMPEGIHPDHSSGSGEIWPDVEVTAALARAPKRRDTGATPYRKGGTPKPTLTTLSMIAGMAKRTQPDTHANPHSGVPIEAAEAWNKDAWVKETTAAFAAFLASCGTEPFTTPEHLWPLIDSPKSDMRAMSMVVQTALREGWIVEVGAIRLRGKYTTRDGVTFSMNKIVPQYQTLLG